MDEQSLCRQAAAYGADLAFTLFVEVDLVLPEELVATGHFHDFMNAVVREEADERWTDVATIIGGGNHPKVRSVFLAALKAAGPTLADLAALYGVEMGEEIYGSGEFLGRRDREEQQEAERTAELLLRRQLQQAIAAIDPRRPPADPLQHAAARTQRRVLTAILDEAGSEAHHVFVESLHASVPSLEAGAKRLAWETADLLAVSGQLEDPEDTDTIAAAERAATILLLSGVLPDERADAAHHGLDTGLDGLAWLRQDFIDIMEEIRYDSELDEDERLLLAVLGHGDPVAGETFWRTFHERLIRHSQEVRASHAT